MKKLVLCVVFLLGAVAAHAADDVSLLDLRRGQLALGGNYEWYTPASDAATDVLGFEKEWTVGVYGSWNLIKELDLIGFTKFGLDNHIYNSALGIRYTIWAGADRGQ